VVADQLGFKVYKDQ